MKKKATAPKPAPKQLQVEGLADWLSTQVSPTDKGPKLNRRALVIACRILKAETSLVRIQKGVKALTAFALLLQREVGAPEEADLVFRAIEASVGKRIAAHEAKLQLEVAELRRELVHRKAALISGRDKPEAKPPATVDDLKGHAFTRRFSG